MSSDMRPHGPRKAVIPAAGLGTRFLPATKAVPKEMLPIVDKPAIQYVVEEAVAAGLSEVLFITGRNKAPIENHFDHNVEVEQALETKGDDARLAAVQLSTEIAQVHYVRQKNPLGLGHAVLCAESFVGNEPFAVLLPDDLMGEGDPLLQQMIEVQQELGGSVIALMEVPQDRVHMYGCAAVEPASSSNASAQVVRITDLVEKPAPGEEPSNLVITGRYVLAPEVFAALHETKPGRGGEIQLTDALQALAADPNSGGVHGVVFTGNRFDTGDRLDFLKTVVTFAAGRDDLGPEFTQWLQEFAAQHAAADDQ